MKKLNFMVILAVATIFFTPIPNSAQSSSAELLNNFDVLDAEEIKKKAANEVTDLNIDGIGVNEFDEVTTTKQGDVVKYSITEYKTAELLPKATLLNVDDSNLYAVYSVQEVSNISEGDEQWDDSNGLLSTSVIYIEEITYTAPDGVYWRLLHSEGGWQRTDASLNTRNPTVTQSTSGTGRNDLFINQMTDYTPTNIASYSYTAPADWEIVNSYELPLMEPHVGQLSQIEIYRTNPNNSWTLNHPNLYNR